jgi:Protein of unknown function (DUF4235)
MTKILFIPISALSSLLAGVIAKKSFERLWQFVDNEESPHPDQRWVNWRKLVAALVLEGAIFRAVRGLFDHAARELFTRLTGKWPGEEAPTAAERG